MKFWVGITDPEWFQHLADIKADEVNFWQPGATRPCVIDPGTPFIFKLRGNKFIAGGGFFVQFTLLPCSLAWDAFKRKNGVFDLPELAARMARLRHRPASFGDKIGCNILTETFFFEERDWIPVPKDWKPNIQRGRYYNTDEPYGRGLWSEIETRLQGLRGAGETQIDIRPRGPDPLYLTRARIGQGAFRTLVIDAYHRRCAVTDEKTLPALEAAHIRSYRKEGPNRVNNGLLLRADIHRLFDDGYVTIDRDSRFLVSSKVKEHFENGREYYRFNGQPLKNLPDYPRDRPSPEFIKWHNDECYENFTSSP